MSTRFDYFFVQHRRSTVDPALMIHSGMDGSLGQYRPDKTFALALAPTNIDYQALAPTTIGLTQGGTTIQRAPYQRRWDLTIAGEFGLRYKVGFDRNGYPLTSSGRELHHELLEFLLAFWREASTGADVRLSWHDLYADRHLWVEPTSLRSVMDGSTQVYPRWSLPFYGYQQTSYPGEGLGAALSFFASLREKTKIAQRWVERVQGALDMVTVAFDTALDFTRDVEEAFDFLPRTISAVAAIGSSVADVVHYPAAWWKRLVSDMDTALYKLENIKQQFYAVGGDYATLHDLEVETVEMQAHAERVALALIIGDSDAAAENGIYVVSPGDTLEAIAAAVFGDSDKWTEIAELNGLSPPYVSSQGVPGTVAPGDVLLLPPGAIHPPAFKDSASFNDALLYGVDIALETEGPWAGDWAVEAGDDPTDVALVTGIPLVAQDLNTRLNTESGEDPDNPEAGVPFTVGAPTYDEAALLTALVREQILRDDRLVGVSALQVDVTGLQVDVEATGVLRSGREVALVSVAGVAA